MGVIIRPERSIVLAFIGEHFWDIRRWKRIQELNDQPMGWNVTKGDTPETFYIVTSVSPTLVQLSVRDYFWPIKESEMTINTNLVQNFDW